MFHNMIVPPHFKRSPLGDCSFVTLFYVPSEAQFDTPAKKNNVPPLSITPSPLLSLFFFQFILLIVFQLMFMKNLSHSCTYYPFCHIGQIPGPVHSMHDFKISIYIYIMNVLYTMGQFVVACQQLFLLGQNNNMDMIYPQLHWMWVRFMEWGAAKIFSLHLEWSIPYIDFLVILCQQQHMHDIAYSLNQLQFTHLYIFQLPSPVVL